MSNFCPDWILSVAVGIVVGDALMGTTSILANSQKFSDGLSKHYEEITKDFISDTANDIIAELNDIGIDEFTPRFVKSFVYNKIKFRNGQIMKQEDEATYLGGIVSKKALSRTEVESRISKALETCRK